MENKVQETRERILEAAMVLFARQGYHATTTRRIAQEADVNEVTLFRHFTSKKDLFDEILELVRKRGLDPERLQGLDLPPVEAIRFVLETVMETLEDNPRDFRILQYAVLDGVEGFEEDFVQKSLFRVADYLGEKFEQLRQEGRIQSRQSAQMLGIMLVAQIQGLILGRLQLRKSPLQGFERKDLIDAVMELYLA